MVYTYNFDDQSITELELFASDGLILAPIQNYDTYEYVGVTKSGKLIIKQTKINNSTKLFYIDLTEAVLNANSHINTAARGKELPECVGYLLISPADDLLLCQEYEFVSNLDYESIKLNSKIKIFSAQSIININEQTKSLLNSEIKSTTPLFPDDKLMMKEEDFDLFKAYDLPSIPFLLFDVPIAWLEDNRFLEVEQVSDLENSFNINKVLLYVSNLKEEKVLIDSGPINTEFKFIGGSR